MATLLNSSPSGSLSDTFCSGQSAFTTTGTQLSLIWTAALAQHLCLLTYGLIEVVPIGFVFMALLSSGVVAENILLLHR